MSARILVVDDEKDVADFLAHFVETLGCEAVKAFDGYSAMAVFREKKPDLILLDYAMPAGSGGDVYRQLRSLDTGKDIPVIFVSATPKYQLEQMMPPDPLVRFVDKPVDAALLGGYIKELLGPKA
jgi:CheY-like chemotaxis protein